MLSLCEALKRGKKGTILGLKKGDTIFYACWQKGPGSGDHSGVVERVMNFPGVGVYTDWKTFDGGKMSECFEKMVSKGEVVEGSLDEDYIVVKSKWDLIIVSANEDKFKDLIKKYKSEGISMMH